MVRGEYSSQFFWVWKFTFDRSFPICGVSSNISIGLRVTEGRKGELLMDSLRSLTTIIIYHNTLSSTNVSVSMYRAGRPIVRQFLTFNRIWRTIGRPALYSLECPGLTLTDDSGFGTVFFLWRPITQHGMQLSSKMSRQPLCRLAE